MWQKWSILTDVWGSNFCFLRLSAFERLLRFHFSSRLGRNIYKYWKIPHFHFWSLAIMSWYQTSLLQDTVPCVLTEDCYETAKWNIISDNAMPSTWEFAGWPLEINEAFATCEGLNSLWGWGYFLPMGSDPISLWCFYCNMLMAVTFFRIYYSSRWHKEAK